MTLSYSDTSIEALKFFYSYASEDEEWRKRIEIHLSTLKRQGLISGWYDRNISAGTERKNEINIHLDEAHIILLLVSPDFIASDYCYSEEMKHAMELHETGGTRVIPIILRSTDWKGTPFEKLQVLPTNALPIAKWADRDDALLDVVQSIRKVIEELRASTAQLPDLKDKLKTKRSSLPIWNIPHRRNPFFTGREDLLKFIYDELTTSKSAALTQPQAISGLGGIGKTQVAVEYAYRYRDNYDAVLWIKADSYDTFISDLKAIADLLGLPEKYEQDQKLVISAVKRWLHAHTGWLMVIDNLENLEMISDFIPQAEKGHSLLTTRVQALGALAQQIEIDKMEPEEGALFLLRRAKIIVPDALLDAVSHIHLDKAQEISQALGGLPLALDQAGAYIEETKCGLSGFLKLYTERRIDLLKRRGKLISDHPESVATTFSLSFDKVQQGNPGSAALLQLCAFLHPDEIPEEVFTAGVPDLGPVLEPIAADPFLLNEAIGELLKYSLLRRNVDTQTITVHRLVQVVLKDTMNMEAQHQWAEKAVRSVNRVLPDVDLAIIGFLHQRYLLQALICTELITKWNMAFEEAGHLLYQTAGYLQRSARYDQAETLHQQALGIRKKVLGPEHPDTVDSLTMLAWIYYAEGKYSQAKQFSEQALTIRKKVLGPEHPDTASSLSQLAVIYRKQGNYPLAEQFHQQSLEIFIQKKGLESADTAFGLQNLAGLYRTQRKFAQAESLAQKALAIREKILGFEHPDTAFSLTTLAQLYQTQGKYGQAEQLYQRALKIREKILGPEHPSVAFIFNNLARLYQTQGKYGQAEQLYQRALEIYEQTVGSDTADTAFTLDRLAKLYRTQGKNEQAELLYRRVLEISEKLLGPEHPEIIRYLSNLASLFLKQRKYTQTEPLYQRLLAIHEAIMGSESPNTASVLEKYADLLLKMKREEEAMIFKNRAKAIRDKQSTR